MGRGQREARGGEEDNPNPVNDLKAEISANGLGVSARAVGHAVKRWLHFRRVPKQPGLSFHANPDNPVR